MVDTTNDKIAATIAPPTFIGPVFPTNEPAGKVVKNASGIT